MQIVIEIDELSYEATLMLVKAGEGSAADIAVANGTPLPKGHSDLISRSELYNQTAEWEAQALEQVNKYNPEDSRDEWRWWNAVLKERGAFKHDVADAPTIIEADKEVADDRS